MGETKVIYHLDDQGTPYLMKLPRPPGSITLLDLKNALNRFNYKYFFKSVDDDFGVVKEEIIDDQALLPSFNGRIVTWLVASDSSVSDTQSQCSDSQFSKEKLNSSNETSAKQHPNKPEKPPNLSRDASFDSRRGPPVRGPVAPNGCSRTARHNLGFDAASSVMSSDIETTSFVDSDDDTNTRVSMTTDTTHRSVRQTQRRKKRRRKHPVLSQASSFSSITDSTMSLNIVTVQLNMENANFLGISIVGQSSRGGGDGGIYVGSIMKGGAVALDGRIEPGDMILEVNGVSFENMTNDDAVRTLRDSVKRPGPITLVVAKCWDPNPKGYFTVARQDPVRPMDPSTWVSQTEAMRGMWARGGAPSVSSMTSATSSFVSSVPPIEYAQHRPAGSSATSSSSHSSKSDLSLTKTADMAMIVRAMTLPDSGLDIRDRMWLKIKIPNSFIGSELVDWLFNRVQGFADRRDARRYACNLLKFGYIQNTVGKPSFSEQCYYILGSNACTDDLSALTLDDIDSVSSVGMHDRDVLRPLPTPPPLWHAPYITRPSVPKFLPQQLSTPGYNSNPYNYMNETASYVSMPPIYGGGAESTISESVKRDKTCACIVSHTYKQFKKLWDNPEKAVAVQNSAKMMMGPFDPDIDRSTSSDTESNDSDSSQPKDKRNDSQASASAAGAANDAGHSGSRQLGERGVPVPRDLGAGNADICASRQSFRMAMSNTYTDDTICVMGDL